MNSTFLERLKAAGFGFPRLALDFRTLVTWGLPLVAAGSLIFAWSGALMRGETVDDQPLTQPPRAGGASVVAGVGIIEPVSEVIEIGSHLSGIVSRVSVQVGQKVAQGDPLFTLDERDARAQVLEAEAGLQAVQAEAHEALQRFHRVETLRGSNAISEEEYTGRKYQADSAVARVGLREAELERARTTLARLTVRAPIEGTILSLDVRVGEFVPAGQTVAPLLRMGDLSTLHVRVSIDETEAERILPQAGGEGRLRSWLNEPILLRFVRIEPFVRPKSNLAGGTSELVDTRTVELVYALSDDNPQTLVGRQMDVFLDAHPMPLRAVGGSRGKVPSGKDSK